VCANISVCVSVCLCAVAHVVVCISDGLINKHLYSQCAPRGPEMGLLMKLKAFSVRLYVHNSLIAVGPHLFI